MSSPPSEAEAYERALELLRRAAGPQGFVAALDGPAGYERVWARDGVVCGLAGVAAGDPALVEALARTLATLRDAQGPHGEIPSNVGTAGASYGTLVGRVDAPLWYALGVAALRRVDEAEAARHLSAAVRALDVVDAWELNGGGLVHVPPGGFWADEYPLGGYVLAVQLLRLWALRALGEEERCERLRAIVGRELRLDPGRRDGLHPAAREQALAAGHAGWAASLDPGGYTFRFDGLAAALVALLGLEGVDEAAAGLVQRAEPFGLVPAYDPPVLPGDAGWEALRTARLGAFRNEPWCYHNGGRWPFVTGIAALGLAACGREREAATLAAGIDRLNAADGWSFPEFAHGRTGAPGGARGTAWSAAAAVLARHAARGDGGAGSALSSPRS